MSLQTMLMGTRPLFLKGAVFYRQVRIVFMRSSLISSLNLKFFCVLRMFALFHAHLSSLYL